VTIENGLETTHYLCIGCPLGCRLEVDAGTAGDIVEIRGFSCRKGKTFAEREHTDPRRMITTTVGVEGGLWARLPVHATEEMPKAQMWDVIAALREISVPAPVEVGDVIVAGILGSDVDVVASRDMPAANPAA
jgi:CxxC motif-containing protein